MDFSLILNRFDWSSPPQIGLNSCSIKQLPPISVHISGESGALNFKNSKFLTCCFWKTFPNGNLFQDLQHEDRCSKATLPNFTDFVDLAA